MRPKRDAFRMTPAEHERQQDAGNRQDDRQHEQEPARRCRKGQRRHLHQLSAPLSGGFAEASGRSVTRPVS